MRVLAGYTIKERRLIIAGLVCALFLFGIIIYQDKHPISHDNQQDNAIHLMKEMVDEVSQYIFYRYVSYAVI